MKVTRFPHDPGPAAWNAILPLPVRRPKLERNVVVDWLVIGGGFTGLSACRRLAQLHPGDRICLLEATRIAEGPAGRNSGFMIDLPHDLASKDYGVDVINGRRDLRLNRAGIAYALDTKESLQMSDEVIAPSGKINGAVSGRGIQHNDAYSSYLDHLNEPYERLDASSMYKITGSSAYIDGLYSPGTVMIQPAMYIRSLCAGVESPQVRVYEDSPVVELAREKSVWSAQTPNGSVSAPTVILTVNGHLESFGFYQRQLMHVFTYGSMTRELTTAEVKQLGGNPTWALTPAHSLGTTVRRISGTGGDRIVIRNTATYDPALSIKSNRLTKVARVHDKSFLYRFPKLKNVEMEFRWGGRLCLSKNNVPAFGELDNNLFVACCQNGLGTAKGTIAGKLAAEHASKQPSELLADQLAASEPTRLPPSPIATLGATMFLKWGEFSAGEEL